MRTFVISGLVIIFACTTALAWFVQQPTMRVIESGQTHPYAFHEPNKDISKIELDVFYAVPKDKAQSAYAGSEDVLNAALAEAKRFHELQFRGTSILSYQIFPRPLVLERESMFYDTTSTENGNPHALVAIAEEIDRRALQPSGDLYDAEFASHAKGGYTVIGILYEGVGASGGIIYDSTAQAAAELAREIGIPASMIYPVNVSSSEGFFILNRAYLTDADKKASGSTIFYHEFAHTIGMPDDYDASSTAVFSDDVMGGGRTNPLDTTYVSPKTLRAMGVAF